MLHVACCVLHVARVCVHVRAGCRTLGVRTPGEGAMSIGAVSRVWTYASNVSPLVASTHLPSMKSCVGGRAGAARWLAESAIVNLSSKVWRREGGTLLVVETECVVYTVAPFLCLKEHGLVAVVQDKYE